MHFPSWFQLCSITWHGGLIFPSLIQQFHYYYFPIYFCYFFVWDASCRSPLFILSSISCVLFIIFACHNFPVAALFAMGMWSKFGKQGVVCAQARPRWVAIGPVLTLLSRKLRPSTARGSSAQYYKKAHHSKGAFLGVFELRCSF